MALEAQSHPSLTDPIDQIEMIARHYHWPSERQGAERIAVEAEGQWRRYQIDLIWARGQEMLRLACAFDMDPPAARIPALYHTLNEVNDQCWMGRFCFWPEERLMVYRSELTLQGGVQPGHAQIETMLTGAVDTAECYYPAMQLVCWGERSPNEALQMAIAETSGRA